MSPHAFFRAMNYLNATSCAANIFVALPRDKLLASAWVDFLHLVALDKPAVRIKVPELGLHDLAHWCTQYGYEWSSDAEGFYCVARNRRIADRVLEVDQGTEPHELDLGMLLGYPSCCCEAVAEVGESRIDEYAMAAAKWEFQGRFQLIDPAGYAHGASLICHLPCSPSCEASLNIAIRAAEFLRGRLEHPAFASWMRWTQLL
jgi:hypothetical protein